MPRPIPPLLAPLVEELELERPQLVTIDHLAGMLETVEIDMPPAKAAYRLKQDGWLLPTGVRGVYEFAPAERAGPISQGNPLLPVWAVIAEDPTLPIAAALGTALVLLNLADRGPDVPELAIPKAKRIPRPLRGRRFRTVHFDWVLPPVRIGEVPVHRPATVLVHLAHRPGDVRSWAAVLEILPRLLQVAPVEEIRTELAGRPRATAVRLAYLTEGVAPHLATALGISAGSTVWFGPRRRLRRHNARWQVADTMLPFAPELLASARAATESTRAIPTDAPAPTSLHEEEHDDDR